MQTLLPLQPRRRTRHKRSRGVQGDCWDGPKPRRCRRPNEQHRVVGSHVRGNEKRGPPLGSDSHIPQSPVYQGHTHTHPSPPPQQVRSAKPDPLKSARAETCETALILPLGLLAVMEEKGREREGLNGTICKIHPNWRLFHSVSFFLGICKGDTGGVVGGTDRRVVCRGCFPRS